MILTMPWSTAIILITSARGAEIQVDRAMVHLIFTTTLIFYIRPNVEEK